MTPPRALGPALRASFRNPREAAAAVQWLLALALLEIALRALPLQTLMARWSRAARSTVGRSLPLGARGIAAERRHVLVHRVAEMVRPGRACLRSALLLYWDRVAEGDRAVTLVLGALTRPAFHAHAWLEPGERCCARGDFRPLVLFDAAGAPAKPTAATKA